MAKDSDELVLDFSGMGLIEDGTEALATVSYWKRGTSVSGEPKISARFKIESPGDLKGRVLFQEFSLQPQALFGIYGFLSAALPNEDIGRDYRLQPDDDYLGLQVAVTVGIRSDPNGVYADRNVVRKYAPASTYAGG